MKRLFGKFGFRQVSYDRPNQPWVCGRACEGKECPFGPDLKGDCQATHECAPVRQDERWVCNRTRAGSDLLPCEEGPSPDGECCRPIPKCTPVRSLRAKRGMVALLVTALSLGVVLMLLVRPEGAGFLTPGDLTHAHSSAQSKCADCHVAGEGMPVDWIYALSGKTAAPDSQRCVKCHPIGDQPLNPHSLTMEALVDSRSRILADAAGTKHQPPTGLKLAALGFAADNISESQMECSACHVEHQGKDHDLKTLSNAQCQVCHSVQFSSFAHGHPPFGDYPFKRSTRLVFDHERHLKLHFQEKAHEDNAPQDCRDCHTLDERGELMVVKGYEQACAQCHQKDFSGFDDNAPALAFLRIPLMDVEGFEEGELNVGEWPDDWDSLETTLTPFTEFLLQNSPGHRHAVSAMVDKDLDVLDEEDWKHGYNLAWGVKELIHDVAENGVAEFERRIAAALGRPLTAAEKSSIAETIAPTVFQTTAAHWFPKLKDEVKQHRADKSPEPAFMDPDEMEERLSTEPVALGGGWFRSDADLTVYYRPTHHADPFMKIWLTLAAKGARAAPTNSVGRLARHLSGSFMNVAPGRCMKCHTPDGETSELINWRGLRPDHGSHKFSRFSHQAHFSLLDEHSCVTCHPINFQTREKPYLGSFPYHREEETAGFVGNFKPIEQATCASCHTAKRAGESCLTCHNYHVGNFAATRLKDDTFERIHEQGVAAKKKRD
jgi:hypothetical protein